MGAIVSSLAAVLNAASTIFTLDLYCPYLAPQASQAQRVTVGRICVGGFMVLGCLLAPKLGLDRLYRLRLWEDPTFHVEYFG